MSEPNTHRFGEAGASPEPRSLLIAAALALATVLIAGVPPFLRLSPWTDATQYDMAARTLQQGGALYRDIFDTNWPGMAWLHLAIRSALGWRYEALRGVDLVIVGSVAWMLAGWLRRLGLSTAGAIWTAAAILGWYVGQPEEMHCQRDVWMLLPLVAAARLRFGSPGIMRSLGEGALWATALWIKPFAGVPALACWTTAAALGLRRREMASDLTALVIGGGVVAALGIIALRAGGSWADFRDIVVNWDPGYVMNTYGFTVRRRLLEHWVKDLRPTSYATIVAVVAACVGWARAIRSDRPVDEYRRHVAGMASLLLGIFVEAAFLQPRVHPYVMAPAIMLAFPMLAAVVEYYRPPRAVAVTAAAVALALLARPIFAAPRITLWTESWAPADVFALRDELGTTFLDGRPEWRDLRAVAAFLAANHVKDGEVICFNDTTHPLYLMLGIKPPIRFMQFNVLIGGMPLHRREVQMALARSGARYVVSDLGGIVPEPQTAAVPPRWADKYPWNCPVVLRQGRYFVHVHSTTVSPFWQD